MKTTETLKKAYLSVLWRVSFHVFSCDSQQLNSIISRDKKKAPSTMSGRGFELVLRESFRS